MAFIIKKAGASARLVRRKTTSIAVPGVGRAFTHTDTYIGSLSLDSTELPAGFPKGHGALTEAERAALERKVFEPARVRLAAAIAAEALRQADPNWRAREAIVLLEQVATLGSSVPLESELAQRLHLLAADLAPRNDDGGRDPLTEVLDAVNSAAAAIRAGCYGVRQEGQSMTDNRVAERWKELRAAFGDSSVRDSLMSALQDARWVTRRPSTDDAAKAPVELQPSPVGVDANGKDGP